MLYYIILYYIILYYIILYYIVLNCIVLEFASRKHNTLLIKLWLSILPVALASTSNKRSVWSPRSQLCTLPPLCWAAWTSFLTHCLWEQPLVPCRIVLVCGPALNKKSNIVRPNSGAREATNGSGKRKESRKACGREARTRCHRVRLVHPTPQ